jgi:hypothetical protein
MKDIVQKNVNYYINYIFYVKVTITIQINVWKEHWEGDVLAKKLQQM